MVVKCGICSASNLKARDELLEEFENVAETVKEMLAQKVGPGRLLQLPKHGTFVSAGSPPGRTEM
jgi:hypothetical protein